MNRDILNLLYKEKKLLNELASLDSVKPNLILPPIDLYEAFEEATSFEAYQNLMSELDRRYTEDGTMIPHELIKDASIVEEEQLEIPGLFSQMGMEEIELPQLNKISEDETDTLEIEDSLYCRDLSKDRQSYI